MTDYPDARGDRDGIAPRPSVIEAIEDLRGVIDDFDDVPLDQMTDLFYVHAYNMLIEPARTLVEVLDAAGISGRTEEWP